MIIYLAGCGAIGSWLGLFLAHPDHDFTLIDDDRVGMENIATSAYLTYHVGSLKSIALAEMMWYKAKTRVTANGDTLNDSRLLRGAELVIDSFDNVQARELTCGLNTVHVGVSAARTGMVMWDECYTLPPLEFERGQNPVCTNHLGKQIIRFTASVAAGIIEHYVATNERRSVIVTESMQVIS